MNKLGYKFNNFDELNLAIKTALSMDQDKIVKIQNNLDIYDIWKQNTPLKLDVNGFYHFIYNPTGESQSDYGTVKFTTEIPITRVYWESPDSFFVEHQGELMGESIINYSTYSGSDGFGQQLFYVYSDFIGDTLTINGD